MGGWLGPDTCFLRLGVRVTTQVLRSSGEEAPEVSTDVRPANKYRDAAAPGAVDADGVVAHQRGRIMPEPLSMRMWTFGFIGR
jgi:hypothetical protein